MPIHLLLFSLSCGFVFSAEPTGIYGRVVNADANTPVRRAAVLLTATGSTPQHVFTSADGSFQFPATVPPADYTLVVQRDGYTEGRYSIKKTTFEDPKEIVVKLRPQAVITGRVTDREGQPLPSAKIQAVRIAAPANRKEPDVVSATESNDLGDYRLAGLDAGSYQVRVNYRGGRSDEFDPTPLMLASAVYGSGDQQPAEVVVKAGSVIKGIDFVLHPAAPMKVSGKVHNDAGAVMQATSVWIYGTGGTVGAHNGQARDGEFTIYDVAPGSYAITAQTLDRAWFGSQSIEMRSEDLADVDIVLKPAPKIEAEVRVEGNAAAVTGGNVYFVRTKQITMMPMEIGKVDSTGKFTLPLIPGEYKIAFDKSLSKLGVRSVTLDDKPITNWKIQVDDSPGVRKLVIVVGGSQP